jgi:PIN domain nuclease of toxin-antitoxin system
MAHFVIDCYAMLAYFRNEEGSEKVEQLLNDAVVNKHEFDELKKETNFKVKYL